MREFKDKERKLKENHIYCGDALDILKTFPDECIDDCFTSPPYNFNMAYDKYIDQIEWDIYFEKIKRIFAEVYRVLKPSGRIGINIMPMISEQMATNVKIAEIMNDIGFNWKQTIIWNKMYNGGGTKWGSWKSPSAPYPKQRWEYIDIFYKGEWKKEGKKENIDITEEEFMKYTDNLWKVKPETDMNKIGHPAMFPLELVYRFIKLFTFKNSIILDPFMGAGTTAIIASIYERKYIGIEISADYIRLAKRRLKYWTPLKVKRKINGKKVPTKTRKTNPLIGEVEEVEVK